MGYTPFQYHGFAEDMLTDGNRLRYFAFVHSFCLLS